MPLSAQTSKAGRVVIAVCMSFICMAFISCAASAQPAGQREVIRVPSEKSFLNPGPVSSQARAANDAMNGQMSSPAYGPSDRFGGGVLPAKIGGGSR